MSNVDPAEIQKFSALAHRWWDPKSEFRPLHEMNPVRTDYIDSRAGLAGKTVLDVGCGGGILCEGMAARGATVTGIDLADKPLKVAQLHLYESGHKVEYLKISAEDMARERPHAFDVVTCCEMLEHVPDPARTVRACRDALKPGGHAFFATLNRNAKSFLLAIVGAEYVLRLLPRGTHEYAKFIRPSELAGFCREAGLAVADITGMTYNPLTQTFALGRDTDVNYLLHAIAP
ncbi:MAG: bifunctional 2-polyprenyl-6-hydroxyphenol methylase/3-demethylubiquinol 3-O-methyltransferase UbiG [Betaproteobacteria bacterium]|nr:bifunctional 2-polyprenyl-6-hydroxyphenol methylase/3-demethylubiquinol 3-O-methyltransferase UbiG [Betaproteobacteria bacterium]